MPLRGSVVGPLRGTAEWLLRSLMVSLMDLMSCPVIRPALPHNIHVCLTLGILRHVRRLDRVDDVPLNFPPWPHSHK